MPRKPATRFLVSFIVAVGTIASVLVVASPVAAVGMVIQGHVRDALGRALVGVEVGDNAGHASYTDGQGFYRIEETIPQTYTITVSRTGLVTQSRDVSPLQAVNPIDFTAEYVLAATVDPVVVSESPADLNVEVTTWAPATGLCVLFTDATAEDGVALELMESNPDGSSTWAASYHVMGLTPDGSYDYRITASDCVSGAVLSWVVDDSFLVDRSVPQIVPVAPVDGGNAMVSSLRIVARVIDSGSPISPSSAQISLTDTTAGTDPVGVPALWDGETKAIGSANPVALVPDREYRIRFRVQDSGGNESIREIDFYAGTIDIPSTTVAVPEVQVGSGGEECVSGLCLWTFDQVVVEAKSYQVSISGSKHAGFGGLGQLFSLATAQVAYDLAGEHVTVPLADVVTEAADLRQRAIYQQISTFRTGVSQQLGVSGVKALIADPIDVRLPESASTIGLDMPPVETGPCPMPDYPCTPPPGQLPNVQEHQWSLCYTVTGSWSCNPDPLIYFISHPEAALMLDRQIWASQHMAQDLPDCDATCESQVTLSYADPVMTDSIVTEVVLDPLLGHWLDAADFINRHEPNQLPTVEPPYPSPWEATRQVDQTAQLAYPATYPTVLRSLHHYGVLCEYARSCDLPSANETFEDHEPSAADANDEAQSSGVFALEGGDGGTQPQCVDNSPEECQERCVTADGKEVYRGSSCKQTVQLILGNQGGRPATVNNRKQKFFTWVVHGRGMRNLDYDHLSMGWKNNGEDGAWKVTSPFRGGHWRRAQQQQVVENGHCRAEWTSETSWSYGSGTEEFVPAGEKTGYGRSVWQGNESFPGCPDAHSTEIRHRLVAAYLWMAVWENNDHSSGGPNDKSAQPLALFKHRYRKWDWTWKFPCPYFSATYKGVPISVPCPYAQEKERSWELRLDPGKEYWW